jgi:dTDP-4-dehydrorhamnose reductase
MLSSPARVLIVGGDSRIGRSIAHTHEIAGDTITATTRRAQPVPGQVSLDLAKKPTLPDGQFDVVYFCAASTGLAQCAAAPGETRQINVEATLALMREAAQRGAFVVFFSTNLVFDGSRPLVSADARTKPECEYGRQKAEVEQRLASERLPATIIRLTKVLEPENVLFATWTAALMRGETIRPFSDRVMAPVTQEITVQTAVAAARRRVPGVVHVSASHDISYADAAGHFARALGCRPELVTPQRAAGTQTVRGGAPSHTSLAVNPEFFPAGAPDPLEAIEYLAANMALAAPIG